MLNYAVRTRFGPSPAIWAAVPERGFRARSAQCKLQDPRTAIIGSAAGPIELQYAIRRPPSNGYGAGLAPEMQR